MLRLPCQLLLALLLLEGCASSPARLFYERPMHSPRVHGTMAGQPVRMILDTGAQVSAVSLPVARRAGVGVRELGDVGQDPQAQSVRLWLIDSPALAVKGLGRFADCPAAGLVIPPALASLGLEVILSPQGLVAGTGGALVLDLAAGTVARGPLGRAGRRYRSWGRALAPVTPICRHGSRELPAGTLIVRGQVAGEPVILEVDTGSPGLLLVRDSAAARALSTRSDGQQSGATGAGGRVAATTYPGVSLRIGDISATVPATVTPGRKNGTCGFEGRIGMDVLRHCAIIIGDGTFFIRCMPAAQAEVPAPGRSGG